MKTLLLNVALMIIAAGSSAFVAAPTPAAAECCYEGSPCCVPRAACCAK